MSDKFIYCPQCESEKIEVTDYEIQTPDNEYIEDDDGRRCKDCNWEGDVSELVCK